MPHRSNLSWAMLLLFLCLSQIAFGQQAQNGQRPSLAARQLVGSEPTGSDTATTRDAAAEAATPKSAPDTPPIANDVVIRGATILTVTHGKIENGSIYVHNGKIAAIGKTVNAPASATVIDATGKWVMPGIIDPHSHIALDNDVNEATSPK